MLYCRAPDLLPALVSRRIVNQETLACLRAADDATHAEAPADFDWEAAVAHVRAVQPELERIAGRAFVLDTSMQDASFFADLAIREAADSRGTINTVLAFRFSSLQQELRHAIERHGFVSIDSAELHTPYNGGNPQFARTTWWHRFFDWL